jgi:hypothetical protein
VRPVARRVGDAARGETGGCALDVLRCTSRCTSNTSRRTPRCTVDTSRGTSRGTLRDVLGALGQLDASTSCALGDALGALDQLVDVEPHL